MTYALGLHCLPMSFLGDKDINGLVRISFCLVFTNYDRHISDTYRMVLRVIRIPLEGA